MIYNKFIQYISVERRLSVKTIETYASTLKLFKDFLEMLPEARTLETADSDNIRDWMEQLMEQKCSPAYVNRSLAALRTFYKYCYATGVMMKDPARSIVGPKRAKRLPRFLKENEIDRLVDLLSNGEMTFDNVRTRTIIYMLYLTGLRAAELISLDDNMISFVNRELKVTGKRNKQRVIPFGEELHNILGEYIAVRNSSVSRKDDALFVGDKGERITYNKVRKLVKETLPLVSSLDSPVFLSFYHLLKSVLQVFELNARFSYLIKYLRF